MLAVTADLRAEVAPSADAAVRALLKSADDVFMKGEMPQALAIMAEAIALGTRSLGPDAEATLQARIDHGSTRYHLGELEAARAELAAVRRDIDRALGAGHPLALDALNNHANVIDTIEGARAALPMYEHAFELRRATQGLAHVDTISSLGDWAYGLMQVGELHRSLPLTQQVLDLRRRHQGEAHAWTLTAYNNLGVLYEMLGRADDSRRVHEQALQLRLQHLGERHPETLVSMQNLANVQASFGETDEALGALDRTIELMRETLGAEHFSTLDARQGRAVIWADRLQTAQARAELVALAETRARVQSLDHAKRLAALISLALVQSTEGEHMAALVVLDDVDSRILRTLGDAHPLSLKAGLARVRVLLQADRAAQACSVAEVTARRAATALGAEHEVTLELRTELGRALLAAGRPAEAAQALGPVVTTLEQLRIALPMHDAPARQRWQLRHRAGYLLAMQALIATDRVREAWAVLDRARARNLREMLDDRSAALAAGVPAAAWQGLQETRERLLGLGRLLDKPRSPNERAALLAARADALIAAQSQQLALVQRFPRYGVSGPHAGEAQPKGPDADSVASFAYTVLEPLAGEALRRGGQRFGAFVQSSESDWHWVDLGSVATLTGSVTAWRESLAHAGPAGTRSAVAAEAPSTALARQLLAPLRPWLDGRPRWVISHDPLLADLPWDALPWRGSVVGEHAAVVLSPSLAGGGRGNAVPRAPALWAMGDPDFDGAPAPVALRGARTAEIPAFRLDAEGRLALERGAWARLPGASRELRGSASRFRALGGGAVVWSGVDASERQLRRASAAGELLRANVLLLSTHAYFNPRAPQQSALVLRRDGDAAEEDGYVTPAEIIGLRLDADLTVLSACSTGQGAANAADAAAGFAYALRLAGSRQNLLTLWPVNDRAAAAFITALMGRVAAGQAAVDALAETKREFIRHPHLAWRAPRYWAGFVLHGA